MAVNLTSMNQQDIENSIKEYLKSTPEFSGYNFEGSVMSRLIKVLAYNTYINSFYTNMAANESFLDTAQLRANVVSKAKTLGYTPRSIIAAKAKVTLNFSPDDDPDSIFIPKYSSMKSLINGVSLNFVILDDVYVQSSNGSYIKDIDIYEGSSYTYTYTYDPDKEFYSIPDSKVDTTKLRVFIKESSISTERTEYYKVTDITELTSESKVFFLQENSFGLYEIYFGDNVLGKSLETGNIIEIEALISNGVLGNDLNTFVLNSFVGYNVDNNAITYVPTVTTANISSDGQDRESISQIKFSAPKQYEMQKRTVTAKDYVNYLKSRYSDIQSISVWGGEDNDPPVYGKILISAKPVGGYVLSNFRKTQIVSELSNRNVLSIDPIIVDPIFTYVNLESQVYYNSLQTTKTKEQIYNSISQAIKDFEVNTLSEFERPFYVSKLVAAIDDTDTSITNNDTTILYEKRFVPIFGSSMGYKFQYNIAIKNPYSGYKGALTSTSFRLANSLGRMVQLDDDGEGNVRLFYTENNNIIYIDTHIGTIDYDNGTILLNNMNFSEIEGDEVRISIEGDAAKYQPKNNEILLFSYPRIQIIDVNNNNIVLSNIVDVLGNTSPYQTNSVISTVVI